MALIGRQLTSGNYQKLDDISASFNNTTKTFNLTLGGQPFYPGSVFSILVSVANVIQNPGTQYTIDQATITFASAPTSGSSFFCIVLGTSLGVGVPADATVTGAKLSQSFNYNSGLLYLDSINNRVGIGTTIPSQNLQVQGNVRITGGLYDSNNNVGTAGSVLSSTGSSISWITPPSGLSISTSTSSTPQYLTFVSSASTTSIGITASNLTFIPFSGNLGIGTTNPTSKLSVVGDSNVTGIITSAQLDLIANATANDSVLYLSGTPTGSSGTNGLFGIGALNFSDTDIIANFKHNVNGYAQLVVQNTNSGTSASSDIIVNNDRTAGTTYYGDFGINGTTFAGGGAFGDPDGTYLYSAGGTLSLGSLNANDVKIATNNTERVRISADGSVGIGTTNPTQRLQVQGNISINGTVSYGSTSATTATVSQTGINSGISTSIYRSVEYMIQATQGTNYHATKILSIHNGTTAYNTEYATIYNNTTVGVFDVDVSGGNMRLLVTPSSASTTTYNINFVATVI